MSTTSGTIDRAQRRDRAVLLGGVLALSLLAWAYLLRLDAGMTGMAGMTNGAAGMALPTAAAWRPGDLALAFLMWAVMMVAMMTPAAAPMILAFDGLARAGRPPAARLRATATFVAAYLLVWFGFSAAATALQAALRMAGLLSTALSLATPALGGALLIAVGAYQFTPLKDACLSSCRTPVGFLMSEWREGTRGALVMGARHGVYCLGCCWALMLALFAAGIMNLLWVALIAAYVLAEKALPAGRRTARVAGLALIAWGGWLLIAG